MAVHGVSRATADVDLLTVDENSLRHTLWAEIEGHGATLRVLKGDFEDPLAGSVRESMPGERVTITPPNRVMFSPPAATPLMQQFSQSTTNSPTFNVAQSMLDDPVHLKDLLDIVVSEIDRLT